MQVLKVEKSRSWSLEDQIFECVIAEGGGIQVNAYTTCLFLFLELNSVHCSFKHHLCT